MVYLTVGLWKDDRLPCTRIQVACAQPGPENAEPEIECLPVRLVQRYSPFPRVMTGISLDSLHVEDEPVLHRRSLL